MWKGAMRCIATGLLALGTADAFAYGIDVPAGAELIVDDGTVDFAGGDLLNAGALWLGNGSLLGLFAFANFPGANADFGSGLLRLTGDFENGGAIAAGTSRVELRDGAAATTAILGATSFFSLSLVSSTGRRYLFESGQTQAVAGTLEIQGIGPPLQVDVTTMGSVAYINLLAGGTQSIANVGVSDVHASGQHLAPTQTNQGGRGNARGWFAVLGQPAAPVPALFDVAALLLAVLLLAFAQRRLRASAIPG